MKKYIYHILFLLISINIIAQEETLPLPFNLNYYTYKHKVPSQDKQLNNKTAASSLNLPFFDDFYYADVQTYPSMSLWQDSSVYINFGYAKYPISLGVATFDGLNKYGYPYSTSVLVNTSNPADTLTSQPINLFTNGSYTYTPSDSIAITFYYQRAGWGDNPETDDSLMLDFYKPLLNQWNNVVWATQGNNMAPVNDSTFARVHIYITDTSYFHDGFKFRFRNKATPVGAVDHWHVDYIYLNKNVFKFDTIIDDAAFYYMSSPLLKNYSAMPYKHYLSSEMGTQLSSHIKNNNKTVTKNVNYQFNILDASHNFLYNYNGGSANVSYGVDNAVAHAKPTYSYTLLPADTTRFYAKHFINTVPDTWQYNDTIHQCNPLTDHFAYDDGEAELAYYLKFYATKLALRYTLNVTDTLQAMDIFFLPVKSLNIASTAMFRMCVWGSGGTQPGALIWKDSLMNPEFLHYGHNQIPRFQLTTPLILAPGTYYFGVMAYPPSSSYSLTIGLDVNYNHSSAAFFDVSGYWQNSSVQGSLMIHPVLGKSAYAVSVPTVADKVTQQFLMYPNPIQLTYCLNINAPDDKTKYRIEIYNTLNQLVYEQKEILGNCKAYLPSVKGGLYFVRFIDAKGGSTSQKLLIQD